MGTNALEVEEVGYQTAGLLCLYFGGDARQGKEVAQIRVAAVTLLWHGLEEHPYGLRGGPSETWHGVEHRPPQPMKTSPQRGTAVQPSR